MVMMIFTDLSLWILIQSYLRTLEWQNQLVEKQESIRKENKTRRVENKRWFFDNKYCEKIMERAQEAKYKQDEKSRNALILTGKAKLVHKAPRQKNPLYSMIL